LAAWLLNWTDDGIVTKRRDTKVAKYNGGFSFTYGPLAYLLKNRVYIGKVHHRRKWFKGERRAILDRQIFEQVQVLLRTNANGSKVKHFQSGALLQGELFDDKGNLMGPSFSTKNGVRYRFYVSSALLKGRKAAAGSVGVSLQLRSRALSLSPFSRIKNETDRPPIQLRVDHCPRS
jgi:site-specific DNA recombinase